MTIQPSPSAATHDEDDYTWQVTNRQGKVTVARMEWTGMGQSSVYTKGQQEGLLFAAGMLDRWRKGQGNR